MKITEKALLHIPLQKPWNLILPNNQFKGIDNRYLNISAGSGNNLFPVRISTKIISPNFYPIHLIRQNKKMKIGPIVGIMTALGKAGIKGDKNNYRDLITAGIKRGVLIYVFSAEFINKTKKNVKAYLYLPQEKKWALRAMPLPDVVYNRVPYRKDESNPIVQDAFDFLKKEGIPFFNPGFFDKWSLYKWLKESYEFNDIVPKTSVLAKDNLKYLLATNSMVYLKPVHGKAGVDFFKIINQDGYYIMTYQTKKTTNQNKFNSYNLLWNKIEHLTKGKEYILQSGIKLKTYKGRPYDVRILVQKNGLGQWKVTGLGIRVAGEKSITTHVPRGGYIESFDKVLVSNFGEKFPVHWKNYLSDLVIDLAKYIERRSGYSLGEMSMDIGIDQTNKIWFFEANSKPMKFDEPSIRELSLMRLIEYFKYLSGFAHEEN